jgi:hypothetical protein
MNADPNPERGRVIVIGVTIALNVITVAALTWAPWSNWRAGLGLNLIDNSLLIGYALIRRDRLTGKLILFGPLIGFLELPTDAWIVDITHSLDYSIGGGPMIWRSPIWMPLAWEVVAVQFGYIGLRLVERFGLRGILLTGLIGAVNIPYYEEMALRIHWWRYHDTAMFPGTHTPWAIIAGEFLIAGYFAYFAKWTRRPGLRFTLLAGMLAGASMFVGYAAPYWAAMRLWGL